MATRKYPAVLVEIVVALGMRRIPRPRQAPRNARSDAKSDTPKAVAAAGIAWHREHPQRVVASVRGVKSPPARRRTLAASRAMRIRPCDEPRYGGVQVRLS